VFDTPAKRVHGPPKGLQALAQVCSCSIPVIALGGIDNSNAESCIRMGAYGIAVIRSVMAVDDAGIALEQLLSVRFQP
jgi:thiamine-phosphate pyrophosphorylase